MQEDLNASQCLGVSLYAVPDKLKLKVTFGVISLVYMVCNREL